MESHADDKRYGTMAENAAEPLRVAFVVGLFPLVSETFVVDQISQLAERGVSVEIFAFGRGDESNVTPTYFKHDLGNRVRYLEYPLGHLARLRHAPSRAIRLARQSPRTLLRALNVFRYGRWALSLKLLYWTEAFGRGDFDVIHCHFGTVARNFVWVRDAAQLDAPVVTTFYGVDVSRVFVDEPPDFYDDLKRVCSRYFVMSEDMRQRVIEHGFPADRVSVHPVGVDVERYPFRHRTLDDDEPLQLVAVGRLVEKKGFDDLLRALALVRDRRQRPFRCVVVGGGPEEEDLLRLRDSLGLQDAVEFAGFMPVDDVIGLFERSHVLLAPSKTARDGDME